jgi:hypothetical protein
MQPGTGTAAPSPQAILTAREQAALTQVLRKLGALGRLDEIARDFAARGVHALHGLDPRAEEMFDDAYWRIDPGEH